VHPELETTLKRETSLGFRPISVPSITSPDELELAIQSLNASAVVLDRHSGTIAELRELVWRADEIDCKVMLASPIGMLSPNDVVVLPTSTHDLTVLASASLRPAARFTKRLFDLVVAQVAILVVLPVLLVAVIFVAVFDGFPIFYRASRIGANGITFRMTKIRTMSSALNEENVATGLGPSASMHSSKPESHRATRIGRVLRRWSIDELPQLFHVVAGTMSLIGPRPRLPHEHSHDPLLLRRLKVKPGITGLWQVSGRGDTPLTQAAELDVRYVDSWSLFGDVVILLRTLKTVITGQGAR
jgi:lipopolysaccharide/colanic/teichoic acid biosynthesis glycosyltransferase